VLIYKSPNVGNEYCIVFCDLLGSEVYRVPLHTNENEQKINTSNFSNGVYLYRLETHMGSDEFGKMIISR